MESRAGLYLIAAGLVGVLSLLLLPFEDLASATGMTLLAVRTLSLIQPAILVVILVLVGNALAHRVGLDAPLVRAWATKRSAAPAFRRQVIPAAVVAVAVACLLTAYTVLVVPRLAELSGGYFAQFMLRGPPLLTKLLYGGITEELLMRWGLMSLFAWIGWRLAGKPPQAPVFVFLVANALSALVFAAGHLPLLWALVDEPPSWLIATVMIGNFVPGLFFGWLFWRRGIEAAIMAHAGAHLLSTAALAWS